MDVKTQELKRIYDKFGILEPKKVVDIARDETNPLHNFFEWDDSVAAEKYRLNQAMHLITSIQGFIEEIPQEFHNVVIKTGELETRGYVNINRILNEEDLYKQVLQNALIDLEYWMNKYKSLRELKTLINQDALAQAQHLIAS